MAHLSQLFLAAPLLNACSLENPASEPLFAGKVRWAVLWWRQTDAHSDLPRALNISSRLTMKWWQLCQVHVRCSAQRGADWARPKSSHIQPPCFPVHHRSTAQAPCCLESVKNHLAWLKLTLISEAVQQDRNEKCTSLNSEVEFVYEHWIVVVRVYS